MKIDRIFGSVGTDEKYMRRALELAVLGKGNVTPNPLVGAVIVFNDKIIGEGFHQKYGEAHAEVNAVNSVSDKSLLSKSTIYVTLEPCSHHGKTPPCADLLIQYNFNRVVIGCSDTFDLVDGAGIQKLKANHIETSTFVLEKECREVNKMFFTYHEKKRPYIFLKWAQSSDAFIDSETSNNDEITWISKPEIQPIVHKWRNDYQAILVGKNTVIRDNPSLTVRAARGVDPIRIVLDSNCELTSDRKILNDGNKTIVLNTVKTEENGPVSYHMVENMTPDTISNALYQKGIQSVLIEGGAKTLQSFIDANLWDEACIIEGQTTLNSGTKAPKLDRNMHESKSIFGDTLKFYRS